MNGEYDFEYGILLDAMYNEPQKVNGIVAANRSILEATNRTGENVLRWFAVENDLEKVSLLRSLGSSIQSEALSEAIGLGHTRMVGLLMELGAVPDVVSCRNELSCEFNKLSSRQKNIIKKHLTNYGYDI